MVGAGGSRVGLAGLPADLNKINQIIFIIIPSIYPPILIFFVIAILSTLFILLKSIIFNFLSIILSLLVPITYVPTNVVNVPIPIIPNSFIIFLIFY